MLGNMREQGYERACYSGCVQLRGVVVVDQYSVGLDLYELDPALPRLLAQLDEAFSQKGGFAT